MLKLKQNKTIIHVDKNMEQPKLSYIAGENVK